MVDECTLLGGWGYVGVRGREEGADRGRGGGGGGGMREKVGGSRGTFDDAYGRDGYYVDDITLGMRCKCIGGCIHNSVAPSSNYVKYISRNGKGFEGKTDVCAGVRV